MSNVKHPNSLANLKPFNSLTESEQRALRSKGGKASAKARALKRSIREDLKEQATPEIIASINKRLLSMAEHGNLRAYELVRDGLGEKPSDRIDLNGIRRRDAEKMDAILESLGMLDD